MQGKCLAAVVLLLAGCAAPAAILWSIADMRGYGLLFSALTTTVVLVGLGLWFLSSIIESDRPELGDEADWWKRGKWSGRN